ncbi:BON domain protein [compost metagenome]
MEVTVNNGEVTLAGSVHSRDEKRQVEDIVEATPGVHDVHNNLRVGGWDDSRDGSSTSMSSGGMTGGRTTTASGGATAPGQPNPAGTSNTRR